MADHPLRSATHRCLGGPLPHQLANGPRAHLRTTACMQRPSLTPGPFGPVVSSGISPPFERLFRFRRQVAHVLLTRPPLYSPEGFRVRLACVRHAASVRSEPGSNSPKTTAYPYGQTALVRKNGPKLPARRPVTRYSIVKEQIVKAGGQKIHPPGPICEWLTIIY